MGKNPAKHISDKVLVYPDSQNSTIREITQLKTQKKVLTIHQRWYMDDKKCEKILNKWVIRKMQIKTKWDNCKIGYTPARMGKI